MSPKRWATCSSAGARSVGFLEDGRIGLTNNIAERALRGVALGRKAWLFAGSDRGGERAAAMYSLIMTAKLNDIDPRAWLANVLRRISDHPASRLHELLPCWGGRPNGIESLGSLRGWRTTISRRDRSGRSSVTVNRKRSAETDVLILGGCMPLSD